MQPNPSKYNNNGFLHNIFTSLIYLCKPFVSSMKIDTIDVDYLSKMDELDLSEETHLRMTDREYTQYRASFKSEEIQPPNFMTEAFYLTSRLFDVGIKGMFDIYYKLSRTVKEEIAEYDHAQQYGTDEEINAAKIQMEISVAFKTCLEAILLEPAFLDEVFNFFKFQTVWLTKVVNNGDLNISVVPLPHDSSSSFHALPEYMIENIADFLMFIATEAPEYTASLVLDDFIKFMVVMIGSPHLVNNPYLICKLVDTMCYLLPDSLNRSNIGVNKFSFNPFDSLQLCQKYLVPSLTEFYIEIEHAGETAYYDKFTYRYYVAKIFKFLWESETHRNAFRFDSELNDQRFLRFTNMLINDSIFLLNESFTYLTKIAGYQTQMDVNSTQDLQRDLAQAERTVRSYILLSNETLDMLGYIVRDNTDLFIRSELTSRISNMLNYFLSQLVGENWKALVVRNPEKYNYNPSRTFTQIVDLYLYLSVFDEFIDAVAEDTISYSNDVFVRATNTLKKKVSEDTANSFKVLAEKIQKKARDKSADKIILGKVPFEFLDPILSTIMKDPVKLPTSNVSIDRATISRILLSDPIDPFNREPLTIDQVIPDVELKQRIDDWLEMKRNSEQ